MSNDLKNVIDKIKQSPEGSELTFRNKEDETVTLLKEENSTFSVWWSSQEDGHVPFDHVIDDIEGVIWFAKQDGWRCI